MGKKPSYMYDKHTSLYQHCVDNNIDYYRVMQRIRRGASIEEAIQEDRDSENVHYMYFKDGLTLRQYCIRNNLNYQTVMMRILRGRTLDEALEFNDKRFTADGARSKKLSGKKTKRNAKKGKTNE